MSNQGLPTLSTMILGYGLCECEVTGMRSAPHLLGITGVAEPLLPWLCSVHWNYRVPLSSHTCLNLNPTCTPLFKPSNLSRSRYRYN